MDPLNDIIAEGKQGHIDALRALADWLEANPAAPVASIGQQFTVPLHTNSAVEAFAAEHNVEVQYDDEGNAEASVRFGPVVYRAYGYVDFKEHCERSDENRARRWAARKGMEIRPVGAEAVTA